MQNQTITLLDTHPVLMNTLQPGYTFERDYPEGVAEMRRILDAHPAPLFVIDDVRAVTLTMDDLINAANQGSRGENPFWHHPRLLGIYFITTNKSVEMAAQGIKSSAFGKVNVKVCHSVEDALADIEQVMLS